MNTDKTENQTIADYLHLYIGCDLDTSIHGDYVHPYGCTKIDSLTQDNISHILWYLNKKERDEKGGWNDSDHIYCKLILRPLSSMTEEEARDIAIIMFGQPDSVPWRMENKGTYLNVSRRHYHISFTIDIASGDIDIYDDGELQTTINHHHITIYLLSKGFDLFGLIDSGLAIEEVVSPTLMKEKI